MSEQDAPANQHDEGIIDVIQSSTYRQRVLGALKEKSKTPTELAANCDLSIAHTSRTLSELQDLGLVDLLVSEEQRKGRYYGITDRGREAYLKITEEENK